ncbi:MAG TPA: DUF4142 domain-containing protein [Flavipsychrobacter sp.]|nr:DUF4142 domain-containing protein [Flavipsychrobacter sp.]
MKPVFKISIYPLAGLVLLALCSSLTISSCSGNGTKSSDTTSSMSTTTTDTTAMAAKPSDTAAKGAEVDKNAAFVTDVVKANADEIMMLQAGIDKGTSKELKSDAKKMIKDHKSLAKEMGDYASKKNMTLPTLDTSMNNMGMDNTTGKDWDKSWTDKMVDGHQKTIDKFEASQNEVTDPDLKTLITNTLPTLHSHLDMCQKLQKDLNK